MSSIQVALAVGNGTGPELAAVFKEVIQTLGSLYDVKIRFIQSPRMYHSYSSLLAINDTDAVTQETLIDAEHYRQFCTEVAALGVGAMFRTSISAQALYLVRDQLHAVKVEHFGLGPSTSILLVRDQAQGFYAGYNEIDGTNNTVSRTSRFSKAVFEQILSFALTRARQVWGGGPDQDDFIVGTVTMVYKFHLFDGLFHSWAQEWQRSFGVRIEFVQGDTMNRNLLALGVQGHQLIISANEYADIMQTILLDRFGLGAQESACAENVYLHPEVRGLREYQTAHGSADDLTGKGIVNPSATIRAAAALLEQQHADCRGVQSRVDQALRQLQGAGIATPDQGGSATTAAFVDGFLQRIMISRDPPPETSGTNHELIISPVPLTREKSCLVVVDFQNDFLPPPGKSNEPMLEQATKCIPQAVDWARREGIEVIFVRFLGDEKFQRPSWRRRNQLQARPPWCVDGTWGAEIAAHVQVQAHERVFDKKAQFDPFLSTEFEKFVTQFDQLVVVGLFLDVCVDATVRGAFQRGLLTRVVRECTAALHLPKERVLGFMEAVYGSEVVTLEGLLASSVQDPGPNTRESGGKSVGNGELLD
ncbi:Isochorismatase-like protein [Aspergillus lucknowensis]|uniref:Isochorismatase-like protein n=1 Tax=Aspergillus lucknowensis TaxID=176173 RepID=A0ABR4LJ50_9EURO